MKKSRDMSKVSLFFLILLAVGLAIQFHAFAGVPGLNYEMDKNRPGMDYKSFSISSPAPILCEQACMKDEACKAWTYVKPGIQGRTARCWLKNGVPPAKSNTCCISGIKKKPFTTFPQTKDETMEMKRPSQQLRPMGESPEVLQ
jgi:hypothetical protein